MTATTAAAAAELASEPAIPDLETWGSGAEPSVLASSAPVTIGTLSQMFIFHFRYSDLVDNAAHSLDKMHKFEKVQPKEQ